MTVLTAEQPGALQPDIQAYECDLWRDYIRQRCGLCFTDSRLWLLRQSLWERMRLCGTQSYREYYHYVASHPAGEAEWQALLERLLNHETSFFRSPPSFAAVTEHVLPELLHNTSPHETITMWSAGCSTGQEAYSLAMVSLELTAPAAHTRRAASETPAGPRVRVIGSDISPHTLHKARCGLYKSYEMRALPYPYRQRYFTVSGAGDHTVFQVVPMLRQVVEFGLVNLHHPDTSPFAPLPFIAGKGEGVDVIFCQNVLIYFIPDDRVAIVQRLCQRLRPGGYLFLGPADVVGLKLPGIQPVRRTDVLMYQRT